MLDIFRTRQLHQAAFLMASGAKFLRCDPNPSGNVVDLIFADPTGTIARLAEEYFRDGKCSALKFSKALTELRVAIAEANGTRFDKGVRR
jgi:hypothetical protein